MNLRALLNLVGVLLAHLDLAVGRVPVAQPAPADIAVAHRAHVLNAARLHLDHLAAGINHFVRIHRIGRRSAVAAYRTSPGSTSLSLSLSLSFLSFLSFLSSDLADTGQGASCPSFADFVFAAVVAPASGCFAGAGISPPTGVVPGAGCVSGAAAGVDCVPLAGVAAGALCAAGEFAGAAAGAVAEGFVC